MPAVFFALCNSLRQNKNDPTQLFLERVKNITGLFAAIKRLIRYVTMIEINADFGQDDSTKIYPDVMVLYLNYICYDNHTPTLHSDIHCNVAR
jgi:hypothetical protein